MATYWKLECSSPACKVEKTGYLVVAVRKTSILISCADEPWWPWWRSWNAMAFHAIVKNAELLDLLVTGDWQEHFYRHLFMTYSILLLSSKRARALPTIQCMFGGLMWEHCRTLKVPIDEDRLFVQPHLRSMVAWRWGTWSGSACKASQRSPWLSTQKWFSVAKVVSSPFVELLEMICDTMWVSYCQHTFRE